MMTNKAKSRALIAALLLSGLLAGCQEPKPTPQQLYFNWDDFVTADTGHYTPRTTPPPRPAPVAVETARPVARPAPVTAESLDPVPASHAPATLQASNPPMRRAKAAPPPEETDVADDTATLPRPHRAPLRPADSPPQDGDTAGTDNLPVPHRADRSQLAAAPDDAAADKPVHAVRTANAAPFAGAEHFQWPLHGKLIADYGSSTDGQRNDGINIAVASGTPILAAADGTVGYAGGDMKSYGNLVVIRHDGNYFTAYAHAEKLLVKTGDRVKAGQTIGFAGQTGDVDAPQLHFEIRKGHEPVDPKKYLMAKG